MRSRKNLRNTVVMEQAKINLLTLQQFQQVHNEKWWIEKKNIGLMSQQAQASPVDNVWLGYVMCRI